MSEYVTFETCYQLAHALFVVAGVTTAADAHAVMARFYGDPHDDTSPTADTGADTGADTEAVDGAARLNRVTLARMIDSVASKRQQANKPPEEPSPSSGAAASDVDKVPGV